MGRVRFTPELIIGKLSDELLNGEIFDTLLEAKVVIENWGREYNLVRRTVLWDIGLQLQRLLTLKNSLWRWYLDRGQVTMFYFLLPLLIGFAFNWASAFTHFYSKRRGQRAGKLASFVLRNILGIPVWVFGLARAARSSAAPLFNANLATQVLGWLLLVAGTIPMIWGLHSLGWRSFRPTERDTLVSGGIFKHIRHPIYSGLLIDFIALILLRPTKPALVACVSGCGYVLVQARLEGIDLLQRIPAYREYMLQVPRFFPRFWE